MVQADLPWRAQALSFGLLQSPPSLRRRPVGVAGWRFDAALETSLRTPQTATSSTDSGRSRTSAAGAGGSLGSSVAAASLAAAALLRGRPCPGPAHRRRRRERGAVTRHAAIFVGNDERVVGIDLGTSTSCIATMVAGEPSVVPNAEGESVTPSVVAWTKKGELLVGESAKRQAALNPLSTFASVKRFMGRSYEEAKEDAEAATYKVLDDNGRVRLDCPTMNCSWAPEEVSAEVLKKLKADASAYFDCKIEKAVITVPAYFNDAQRQATKNAAKLAGIDVMRICTEPTMAALAYGLDQQSTAILLVLDLGGGTYDVSILEVGDGVCEVLATSGDTHLGGDDFDRRILDWLADGFQEREGIDLRKDPQALQRLTEAAEKAKTELSVLQQTRISIPFVAMDQNGPKNIEETLTRYQFEALVQDLLERMQQPVQEALTKAEVLPKQIKEVVAVGGSSRIPAVQELAKVLGFYKPMNAVINPSEVVALGASLHAAMLAGEVNDIMLIDVTPLTLGVETDGGVFTPVMEKNTSIPHKAVRFFTTTADAQDEIEVVVLQGERPMAKDNKVLGRFTLTDIPPAPAGTAKIEVVFEVTVDGLLKVSAQDWATRQTQKVTIKGASQLDDEEVEEILKVKERNFDLDEMEREIIDMKYAAEKLIEQTEFHIEDLGEKIPSDALVGLMPHLEAVKAEMSLTEDSRNYEVLKGTIKDLRFELMKVGQRVFGKQVAPDNVPGPGKRRSAGGTAGGTGAEDDIDEVYKEPEMEWTQQQEEDYVVARIKKTMSMKDRFKKFQEKVEARRQEAMKKGQEATKAAAQKKSPKQPAA